jgi:selenocysteine lyase/cysteine desulfurase
VPAAVANAQRDYMLSTYVQLTAGYPASTAATATVDRAHAIVETLMNAPPSSVVLGPSTTALMAIVADSYLDEVGVNLRGAWLR